MYLVLASDLEIEAELPRKVLKFHYITSVHLMNFNLGEYARQIYINSKVCGQFSARIIGSKNKN